MKTKIHHAIPALYLIASLGLPLAAGVTARADDNNHATAGDYIDDAAITAKVKAAFAEDKVVSVFDIKVETDKGNVLLTGTVDSHDQKTRAKQLAENVAGVKSVENNLHVKSD